MFRFKFISILLPCLITISCENKSDQDTKLEDVPTSNTLQEPQEDKAPETTSQVDSVIREYNQLSNGLEYKVAQHFQDKFLKGELLSVVNGMGKKMDPKKNKVYLDTELFAKDGLVFFHMKNPEFLVAPKDSVISLNRNLLANSVVNCKSFSEGKASDFLLKKENYNTGDLQIIISKAFYYKGAYYVHAWTLSNSDKLFHHRNSTFKFDRNQEIVDIGFVNTYQMGYSQASKYLKDINTKEERIKPVY